MSEHPEPLWRRQVERAEKKSAAANRENEALRREVRRLRHENFALRHNLEGLEASGYKVRFEKLVTQIGMIRELATTEVTGLPYDGPKTLEPWKAPGWAKKEAPSE